MWRKNVVAGLLALLVLAPVVLCAYPQQGDPHYVAQIDAVVAELKEATTVTHSFGHVEILTNVDQMIPPAGEENLLALAEIVDEAFDLWKPTVAKPLRVYFVDYETYRRIGDKMNPIFSAMWNRRTAPPESSFGYFIPLVTGEYAYVTNTWNWFVHLHEMFHIALTSHVSLLTGTNHGAVDPEVQTAWLSPKVQDLVDAATKGVTR